MNYEFNRAALIEYREAVEWYNRHSIFAGSRFTDEVEAAIQAILRDPERYQPVDDGVRIFRLKRFPFKLYYLIEPDLIVIYAVMHDRRRPDTWRNRLP